MFTTNFMMTLMYIQQDAKKDDLQGYNIIFDEETELMKDITERNKQTNVRPGKTPEGLVDEVCIEEILENEHLQKDPVRRYQFEDYNKSLCMSNMYPEVDPVNSVILAPGEGKIPKNVLFDNE